MFQLCLLDIRLCEREIEKKKNEMALTFLIVSVFDSKTKGRDEGEG